MVIGWTKINHNPLMNVHPQVYEKLSAMTLSEARRYLRRYWCDYDEQESILADCACQPENPKGWLSNAISKLSTINIRGDVADS